MYDEPFADSSAIPTYLVAKEAVKSVKVALSADGGDELFGGYNRYKYFFKIPRGLKLLPAPVGVGLERAINAIGLKGLNAQRLAKFSRFFGEFSVENYLKAMTQSMPDKELASFLLNAPTLDAFPFHEANTPLGSLMLNDTLNYLPNDILHKVDRATMAVGLEGREPFLDHTLLETLARLPDAFKCSGKQSKILLRHIAHDYIPETLLSGPKKGFAIPINRWMRSHLKNELLDISAKPFLTQQGLFHPEKMEGVVHDFLSGKDTHALFVWYFYTFQIWYNIWIQPAK
jgi:asparagine synthase (glutamine-hydrolysing)